MVAANIIAIFVISMGLERLSEPHAWASTSTALRILS
jgi:hypothetical protein